MEVMIKVGIHLTNYCGPEEVKSGCPQLLCFCGYLILILVEANMCHLEVDFDNIWENFIKPAQVTFSILYLLLSNLSLLKITMERIWNSQVWGPSF